MCFLGLWCLNLQYFNSNLCVDDLRAAFKRLEHEIPKGYLEELIWEVKTFHAVQFRADHTSHIHCMIAG